MTRGPVEADHVGEVSVLRGDAGIPGVGIIGPVAPSDVRQLTECGETGGLPSHPGHAHRAAAHDKGAGDPLRAVAHAGAPAIVLLRPVGEEGHLLRWPG